MFGDFSIWSSCISEMAENSEKYFVVPNPSRAGLPCGRIKFSDFKFFYTFATISGEKGSNTTYLTLLTTLEVNLDYIQKNLQFFVLKTKFC